jgi:hypothetical protein
LIAAGLFIVAGIARPFVAAAAEPVLSWVNDPADTNRWNVEVSRLSPSALQMLRRVNWTRAQWEQLLSARVVQDDLPSDIGLPAMIGRYEVAAQVIRFVPQFPVQPGVKYRATFFTAKLHDLETPDRILTAVFQLGALATNATTVVQQIYPSADTLPENLLKFYLHFSAPMRRGHIYDYIHLRNAAGHDVALPFLEIDEELWNPAMTRLTLFIDPGRIKRGVQPLEEIGPALEQGKSYTLVIDREWPDAKGALLKESFRKTFKVGPPDRTSIDITAWKIRAPKADARTPLTVTFSKPMDHALAQRVIRVADNSNELIDGKIVLDDHERRWTFIPNQTWRAGPHALLVEKTIEDLAGNNIGKAFEVDLFEGVQRRFTNETVRLPFEIR